MAAVQETSAQKERQRRLTHYLALQNADYYLRMAQLEDGCLYLIHARNSHVGRWEAAAQGFVILREKLGQEYLFTEYHWDKDKHGTAKPFVRFSEPISGEKLAEVLKAKLHEVTYDIFMERTNALRA